MKIGIDARMYRSGVAGIGRYSQNLIKNLLEIDKENQYILFMTSEDAKEFKDSMTHSEFKNYQIRVADIPHYSLAEQIKLPKIIAQENLDLMHFLHFNVPVRRSGKFIVTIHDLTLLFYPQAARETNFFKQLAFKYVMKKACQNAVKIIAVSESTKKDIIRKFQIESDKVKVIYEAADDKINLKSQISNLKIKEKYHIQEPIILYVGQFRGHKNLKGLIEAFKTLRRQIVCQLVLVGRGELLDIDISSIKRDIVMPGFVSDEELACWYKIASVFVMPSFYEGFGLPGLEAMTAGVPVAASRRASLPEIYQDAAIYFDPFKPSDIADKIKVVLEDQKLRDKLIRSGQRVAQEYSWRKTAEETLKIYQAISNV